MLKSKLLIVPLLFVFAAFTAGVPALAATQAFNSNTGFESLNDNSATAFFDFDVENENEEDVKNEVNDTNVSGENQTKYNTGNTDVQSGRISIMGILDNLLNQNDVNWAAALSGDLTASNDTTGASSHNIAKVFFNGKFDVENENEADVENSVTETAMTGYNAADYNTGNAVVDTGSASIDVDVANSANTNSVNADVDELDPTIEALNSTTGFDSFNLAVAKSDSEFDIENENKADFYNLLDLFARTGHNSARYNTGSGNISTGNSSVSGTATNSNVNSNVVGLLGPAVDLNLLASNGTTGALSTNKAIIDVENETELENENKAGIANVMHEVADTGYNAADYNTGAGTIDTGDATAMATALNENVNSNSVELGSLQGTTNVSVSNDTTGADSTNKSIAKVENETEVENENEFEAWNALDVKSNTGWNQTSYNTGAGSVTTGNAASGAMIVNEANVNAVNLQGAAGSLTLEGTNSTTGANSTNIAEIKVETEVKIENENEAELVNNISSNSNSGKNTSSFNTGAGTISSGAVMSVFGISNTLNSNVIE